MDERDGPEGDRSADEIRAELDSHFEGTVELLMARGWSEEDARAEARRRFGDVGRYRAELERIARRRRSRERARALIRSVGSVLAGALTGVRRSPGLSAAVILTLALGIGANAAVFRVVDRLLLSAPEHIVAPSEVSPLHQTLRRESGEPYTVRAFTYPDVRALREAGLPARFAAAAFGLPETLGEGDEALRVRVARVDSAYLSLLGVGASLGRVFAAEDHRAGAPPVALLGHDLWREHFGSDPAVLGRALRVRGGRYQVVGILPAGFIGAGPPAIDVWLPVEAEAAMAPGGESWTTSDRLLGFRVLARTPPGVDVETVRRAATEVLRRSRTEDYALVGELDAVGTSSLVPGDGPAQDPVVDVSRWLAGVALLVLLVACANVANLFLARGERLRRATAVRLALGAGRVRIVLESFAGVVVLALLGSAAALGFAVWGGDMLEGLFLSGIELEGRPRHARLLLFVTGAGLVAAVLSGLLPALASARHGLGRGLTGESRTATGAGRLRRGLVALQAGLSTLLLVGALLFVQSLRAALRVDLGFDPERVAMVEIEGEEGQERATLYRRAEESLASLPEVEAVAGTIGVPFRLIYGLEARLPGEDSVPRGSDGEALRVNAVGERYFLTLGIPLLQGRPIEARDLEEGAEPVAVVSAATAERLWPERDPIGRCLVIATGEEPCARVVGVAAAHAGATLSLPVPGSVSRTLMAWVPFPVAGRDGPFALLVRPRAEGPEGLEAIRREVLGDPGVRFAEVELLTSFVDDRSRTWRLGATVFTLFGAIALGVAALGLYAVLAYDVARRRREIGIRMALGAHRRRVMAHVLGGGLATVALGLAVALPLAAWLGGRLDPLLFEGSPPGPAVFALAAGALLATAGLAAALPAWRATRVEPSEALVEE